MKELPFRFGRWDGTAAREFRYSNTFQVEQAGGVNRVKVGVEDAPLSLLYHLLAQLSPPFLLLYVLHTSRCDSELSRYQSHPLDWNEWNTFAAEFCEFLTADGRHDLWLHSRDPEATLVWDRHNVIYAYGPIEDFVPILRSRGLVEGDVSVPVPHVHLYHGEFDEAERKIVRYFDWKRTPLTPSDLQM